MWVATPAERGGAVSRYFLPCIKIACCVSRRESRSVWPHPNKRIDWLRLRESGVGIFGHNVRAESPDGPTQRKAGGREKASGGPQRDGRK